MHGYKVVMHYNLGSLCTCK